MRQIVLDTETTGLDPLQGHRVIEIGCLELVNRRLTGNSFHFYLQPDREIEADAIAVHGITNEFLHDKPRFADIADDFIAFVRGAELVIHNAAFDVGFLDHELSLLRQPPLSTHCSVLDTLRLARHKHPGQKNNLDALARRYGADARDRTYHGALLDAEILADVYLAMTGGQVGLMLHGEGGSDGDPDSGAERVRRLAADRPALPVIAPTDEERLAHEQRLQAIEQASGGHCLFRRLDPAT